MVEIVSWICVAIIAVGALVGFLGVVSTSVVLAVRSLLALRSAQHTHMKAGIRAG